MVSAELTAPGLPDARFTVDVTSGEDASHLLVGDENRCLGGPTV